MTCQRLKFALNLRGFNRRKPQNSLSENKKYCSCKCYYTYLAGGALKREKSIGWRGGITPLTKIIRHLEENRRWIKSVFTRDNWTCQECFRRGNKLNAHHKNKSFSQIFNEFLQTYPQFSPIEDKETLVRLAVTYKPFWDINNGMTLCKKCHDKTKKWGDKYAKIRTEIPSIIF